MEGFTMATLISDAGLWFTQFVTWAGTVGSTVAGNPLMLTPYLVGFGFAGVGLFKSLTRR